LLDEVKEKAVFFIDDSDFNIEDIGYCKNCIYKEPNIGFNGYRIFGSPF
jgi:hypothetical protein